uniref:Tyrosine-protein kinase n=1 Tax=Cyprinus carpio TaxID=7962 RepID=A0A8C1R2T1_CYPCA
MSRRGRSKKSKTHTFTGQCEGPGLHVFLLWTKEGERCLSYNEGEVTAEDLTINAAKAVGITPVCHALFALYDPASSCWYSPNHKFNVEDQTGLLLHFRMRFYFRNWHGLGEKEPLVTRHALRTGTGAESATSPLLELTSLEYLFAQAKYDFVNDLTCLDAVRGEEEISRFKNECLGMAVLHLSYTALQSGSSLQDVAKQTSFLHCIPQSFSRQIARNNALTRFRIRRVFANFVSSFQQHTVGKGQLGPQEVMYKYISTLERLAPKFGTETFPVFSLDLRSDEDGSGSHLIASQTQTPSEETVNSEPTHEIRVSGSTGICWRKASAQWGNDYIYNQNRDAQSPDEQEMDNWNTFCDFPEISHIAIQGINVCISRQDNMSMDMRLGSSLQARSLVSLLDGYFRLTTDAHHYLCHEVAPPRVVLSGINDLHGPILDEFVLQKLKKEAEEGTFIVRWSVLDYDRIILASLSQTKDGENPIYKQFRITLKGSKFRLEGWDQEFSSIKELTSSLKTFVLKSGEDSFTLKKCCLPRPGELSNLLVMRKGANSSIKTVSETLNLSQLRFHQIKDKEITKEQHLGRGTRTNIYAGWLKVHSSLEDDDDESNNNHRNVKGIRVVLKILDQSHKDIALETKRLVHGNVCGKNILVVRKGLEEGMSPFVKLSDPGISQSALSRAERVERIPWIAPECIADGARIRSAADQWSFGATLLEICNNGDLPISGSTLPEKERFYETQSRLAVPSSQELASFISMCLTYDPAARPSFRTILRELTEIQIKNPDISSECESLPDRDPSIFYKRYLKKIRDLGEGHFGKVMLYVYDPGNDGTGEYVAVKALKQESGSNLHDSWMKEIEILKSLYHNNIVKYKGCCTELGGQVVQLIMEYLPLGSLREYIPKHRLGIAQSLLFAQQICMGMDYLHSKRYIHRDLAARNVLVENEGVVKIGDFGLTKYIPEGEIYYRVREDGDSPVFWYAIECLKESKFSFASDVWSFAVTLYEILTNCNHRQSPPSKFFEMMGLVQGQMTVVKLITLLEKNERLPCPRDCPREVYLLMEQCWDFNPGQRPSFSSLAESLKDIRQTYKQQPSVQLAQLNHR